MEDKNTTNAILCNVLSLRGLMLSGDLVGYKIKKKNGEALQFHHIVFYTYTVCSTILHICVV